MKIFVKLVSILISILIFPITFSVFLIKEFKPAKKVHNN